MQLSQLSKRQIVMLVVAGGLLALFLLLICMRGWVRNSVVPFYVEHTTGEQLKDVADKQLLPVHQQLAPAGLRFAPYPGYVPGKMCGLAYFHNFKETVHCGVSYRANPVHPTQAQKDAWLARSDTIEPWLKTYGWKRMSGYYDRPLGETQGPERETANYEKQVGLTMCQLYLSWQAYESYTDQISIEATTSCSREVTFFGGNDTLQDDSLL